MGPSTPHRIVQAALLCAGLVKHLHGRCRSIRHGFIASWMIMMMARNDGVSGWQRYSCAYKKLQPDQRCLHACNIRNHRSRSKNSPCRGVWLSTGYPQANHRSEQEQELTMPRCFGYPQAIHRLNTGVSRGKNSPCRGVWTCQLRPRADGTTCNTCMAVELERASCAAHAVHVKLHGEPGGMCRASVLPRQHCQVPALTD